MSSGSPSSGYLNPNNNNILNNNNNNNNIQTNNISNTTIGFTIPNTTTTTNTTSTTSTTSTTTTNTASKIIDASRKGNTELICKLLKKDWKKINKRDEKGDGCLHKAALFGHADSIEAILKYASNNGLLTSNQVNINMKNHEGYTPFMYACLNNWKECCKTLLSYGADVNEKLPSNPGLPLSYSITNGTGVYSWKIENFSKIKDRKIQSNTFLVSGFSWKLVAYPRGSKSDDNFSLYLEVANYESLSEGWSHLANFTFTITNQTDSNKKIIREVMAHRFHRNHTDLGFSQILKKEMIKDKKSGWLLNDTLLVEFKIEVLLNSSSSYQNDETSIYTWKIHNVSSMKERATSPIFKVGNCKWTIALYPKGKGGGNNLSVYLKVADKSVLPLDWFFLVSFKFSLIDQRNGTKFTRQVEGKRFKENVEDWGFPQFMKLSSLYDRSNSSGFLKTIDDSIIIELQMEIVNDFTRKKQRDLNSNDWGLSPLHLSAFRGLNDAVRLLLILGANSNITDSKGRTPLDWCAYNGDLPTSEVLISIGGADINCKDTEGYTPLHKAVMNGHLEVARLLVKHGACVNAKNNSKVTPLELAIRVNRMWCVETLIQWGADLNQTDKQGRSPLHWAIFLGDPKLLSLLVKYGCSDKNIEKKINNGTTNTTTTTATTSATTSTSLKSNRNSNELANGVNSDQIDNNTIDDQNESTQLDQQNESSSSQQQTTTPSPQPPTTTTTTTSTNTNTIPKKSVTPLKINIVDQDGFTPLHKAITRGKGSFVKLLLEKGADPTMVTKDNRNALHLSVSANEYYITQLILDYCEAPEKLYNFDDQNQTPLHKSVINGNMKILELLVSRGANVNCNLFSPAINEAIKNNDILCIIYLLQNQAEIHKAPKLLMTLLSKRIKSLRNNSNLFDNSSGNSGSGSGLTSSNGIGSNLVSSSSSSSTSMIVPPCSLSRDMLYLVNNPSFKDITFIVEDRPIYALKGILCARSDYFRAMFEIPLKESLESEIKIESISYSTFLLVLQYLYTGELLTSSEVENGNSNGDHVNIDNLGRPNNVHYQLSVNLGIDDYIQLFIASNRFMVNRLKLICETLIIKEYNSLNIYSIFKLTDIYESSFLLNEAVKYLSENYQQIPETNFILKMSSFRKSLLDILKRSLSGSGKLQQSQNADNGNSGINDLFFLDNSINNLNNNNNNSNYSNNDNSGQMNNNSDNDGDNNDNNDDENQSSSNQNNYYNNNNNNNQFDE